MGQAPSRQGAGFLTCLSTPSSGKAPEVGALGIPSLVPQLYFHSWTAGQLATAMDFPPHLGSSRGRAGPGLPTGPGAGLPRLFTCCVTSGRTLSLSGPHAMFQELLDLFPELFPIREPTPGGVEGAGLCCRRCEPVSGPAPGPHVTSGGGGVGGVALSHPPAAAGAHRCALAASSPAAPEISR